MLLVLLSVCESGRVLRPKAGIRLLMAGDGRTLWMITENTEGRGASSTFTISVVVESQRFFYIKLAQQRLLHSHSC